LIVTLLRSLWPFAKPEQNVACRVLFVCMGNLCRSPSAEAVFRRQVELRGLSGRVLCSSAGTHDIYVGVLADGRARAAAARRGYDMSRLRGRLLSDEDFVRFDLILAMDRQNLAALQQRCPEQHAERLHLLMEFARSHDAQEVPDPYFGNAKAFELVLDMVEDACTGLLEHVRARYMQPPADARPPVTQSAGG
jgi:protein-tyrosine phosphatase